MKKVKAALQYIFIIVCLLIAIWSQCWLLFCLLIGAAVILWHPQVKKRLQAFIQGWSKLQRALLEWSLALTVAALLFSFINTFGISFYTLRSSSMHPTYQNNELIIINKMAYGPACHPNTVKDYRRLKGFTTMKHGDVIAFHFPEADTSFIDFDGEDYHYIKRQYQNTKTYNRLLDAAITYTPVTKRKAFIKRLIALPGDTLRIINGDYKVNGHKMPLNQHMVAQYTINTETPADTLSKIRRAAITHFKDKQEMIAGIQGRVIDQHHWGSYLNRREDVLNMPNIYVFPFQAAYLWNASYLGPIILPTKGKTVQLTPTNLALYSRIIEAYEENQLQLKEGTIYINGKASNEYTFRMNYYWVAGDNQKHSFDSRYWGFVPENHIIGRVEKLNQHQ
ncbi:MULTISPECIES: signal peptidase I [unclassified Carboxylicivirga]|uniref:signal peptidase I n=1 Tax=Carboxylicivirga TaxID=1628153 RepID=UPI003D33352E